MSSMHDAVVVGGGLAGLSAARRLKDAGADVVVLEARDRVGGKAASARTEYGDVVEYGGQWVGADQERILALLDEFDVETRPQYDAGKSVARVGGQTYTYGDEGMLGALPDESAAELRAAFDAIAADCERVPRAEPQTAPLAEEWDATTLESWLREALTTDTARAAFRALFRGIYTAEPADVSYLFFLYYARTAGGFDMVSGHSEEMDSHEAVVVGAQDVAEALAGELGERVHFDSPVRRIEHLEAGVRVETPGSAYDGRYAVVALPPTLAGRIAYDPPVPARRDELTQRMPNGAVVKCLLRYEAPFWRDAGFSGYAKDEVGPANYCFDDGSIEGDAGRMVAFVCGDGARTWTARSAEERRAAVADQLADLFGDERFAAPVWYADRAWDAEPHSRGAYHGYPTPGTMTDCWGALREPVGRLHWAGAETATRWYGHMDGAVRSGERAAEEIRARL